MLWSMTGLATGMCVEELIEIMWFIHERCVLGYVQGRHCSSCGDQNSQR